jgi:hypothetical protein
LDGFVVPVSRPPPEKTAEELVSINWSILVPGPGGVPVPTYGNYGGPGYSDGEVLSSPDQPVDYSAAPVDPLDELFRFHDMAYASPSTLVRAEGDLALIQGIQGLSLGLLSPEQSLYAGAAIVFGIQQLALVNGHPELLSQSQLLAAANTAVHDIQYGLGHLEPDDAADLRGWLAATGSAASADLLPFG